MSQRKNTHIWHERDCECGSSVKVKETHRKGDAGGTGWFYLHWETSVSSLLVYWLLFYFPLISLSFASFLEDFFNLVFSFITSFLKLYPFYCIYYANYFSYIICRLCSFYGYCSYFTVLIIILYLIYYIYYKIFHFCCTYFIFSSCL